MLEPQKPSLIEASSPFPVHLPLSKNGSCLSTSLISDISKKALKTIVDTGSTHSLVKLSAISVDMNIDTSVIHQIKGIANFAFETLGVVFSLITHKKKRFPMYFHVIDNEILPEGYDAVIGCDVLDSSVINLENSYLTILRSNDIKNTNNEILFMLTMDEMNDRLKLLYSRLEKSVEGLDDSQRKQILDLCYEFNDIFFIEEYDKLTATDLVEHEINLETDKPIFTKQYNIPHAFRDEMRKQVRKMYDQGIIKETLSPYNSPVIILRKITENGKIKFRFVFDLRNLNKFHTPIFFDLPTLPDMFNQLGGNSFFSSIDMASSFFQIPVKEAHQERLAFTVPNVGRFMFARVPFGLSSSSHIFMKAIQTCLGELYGIDCLSYIDDIASFSKTFEEGLEKLRKIFAKFRLHHFQINPEKCHFLQPNIKFLGHNVSAAGVSLDLQRIQVIKDYACPTNLKQLRAFLAFVGFYRDHVANFAKIAEPLFKILRISPEQKKANGKQAVPRFYWNDECQKAVEFLKNKLITSPILRLPDWQSTFIVHSDSSAFAVGAQLSQMHEGKLHPIHFASKSLNVSQRRASTFEREFFALVWALETFKHYLLGQKEFIAFVDQKSLIYAINQRLEFNNDKINRFKLKLAPYNMKLCYVKGELNVADFLSRIEEHPEKNLCIEDDSILSVNNVPISNFSKEISTCFVMTRRNKRSADASAEDLFQKFVSTYNSMNKTPSNIKIVDSSIILDNDSHVVYFISANLFDVDKIYFTFLHNAAVILGEIYSVDNVHFLVYRQSESTVVDAADVFKYLITLNKFLIDKNAALIKI